MRNKRISTSMFIFILFLSACGLAAVSTTSTQSFTQYIQLQPKASQTQLNSFRLVGIQNGNIVQQPYSSVVTASTISSGTYIPTITGVSGITSVSPNGNALYTRIGNIVTVNGFLSVTANSGAINELSISLPFQSNILSTDCIGTTTDIFTLVGGVIVANQTLHTAKYYWDAPDNAIAFKEYTFTYIIK
jgi:hypothetical protein